MAFSEEKVKYIISGTNRPNSRSRQISNIIQGLYAEAHEQVEIIDLAELNFSGLVAGAYGKIDSLSEDWKTVIQKVNNSEGLIFVVPEYNGSLPGALKYFIDNWAYPDSFEYRPVAFVGLGGLFGGLRPVEHLQQIMAYRNAYQFPIRIFLINIFKTLQNDKLTDVMAMQLMKDQVSGFQKFCKALKSQEIDASSKLATKLKQTDL